jgi:hypothetical protein
MAVLSTLKPLKPFQAQALSDHIPSFSSLTSSFSQAFATVFSSRSSRIVRNAYESTTIDDIYEHLASGGAWAQEKLQSSPVWRVGIKTREIVTSILRSIFNFLSTTFPDLTSLWDKLFGVFKSIFSKIPQQLLTIMGTSYEKIRSYVTVYAIVACAVFIASFRLRNSLVKTFLIVISGLVAFCSPFLSAGAATAACFLTTTWRSGFYQPQSPLSVDLKGLLKNALICAAIIKCDTVGLDFTNGSGDNIEKIMKRSILVGRAFSTWEAMLDKLADVFDECVSFVAKHFYGVDYVSLNRVQEVEEFCSQVMELLTYANQLKVGRDAKMSAHVELLYRTYLVLRTKYLGQRVLSEQINTYGATVSALYQRCVNKNPNAHIMRKEPVCVVFAGPTCIGKSFLMAPLQIDLLKISGRWDPKCDSDGYVYARCHEQEFWDGYTGQPIVVFDDFGQQVDSISNPNPEFFELIRAVNIFPYQLHSAALHEKANNPFSADFV